MPELIKDEKDKIIDRRGCKSDKTKIKYPPSKLVIHHKDRNTKNNAPENLVVLTEKEHDDLHRRTKK